MKKLLLILALSITSVISQAQSIRGLVKDESGTPVAGATVTLLKDSAMVKLAVTKTDGQYLFPGIKAGDYKVAASFVGMQRAASARTSVASADILIPDLILHKSPGALKEVVVIAQKPIVEVKADKMVLNVEGTINAAGSNALELLRKSPGVLLDKDENISLAGKNGVQVYIDGRTSPLSGQDLALYLKTLQSTQIEAIELITNPSAKYDAAGNAGIINIRLVRNKSLGANGSVNAGWNYGLSAKYNTGGALNYRNKSLNLFSNYTYSYAPNEQRLSVVRSLADSLFNQQGTMSDLRKSHNFKIGADYFINNKSTLGVMVNGILADPRSVTASTTMISNTKALAADRLLVGSNDNKMKRHNANTNLNYSFTDPNGKSLVINADRGSYDFNGDQFQRNHFFDPTGQVKRNSRVYDILSPSSININSVKADYEQNLWKGKLGIGAKSAGIKTDNDFQRYDVIGLVQNLDRGRSNHFTYRENINAGYVNFNRKYKAFSIQAGLRAENTVTKGISDGQKLSGADYIASSTTFSRSYTDLFPSAALTFNKNPMKVWSLTYSRRIDRPAYKDLNPFEFKLDEYTSMRGNTNLRPQYTNSYGITHTYKYKLNMALSYSRVRDMFTDIFDTTETSKAYVSKKNLASQNITNLSVSYPFQYKTFSLFSSISSNYSRYRADFGAGREVELDAFGFNLFAQSSLKFAKTWTAELSGFYNAPTIYQGSFRAKSMYSVDAGLSSSILKGKATVRASMNDIFYSQRFRASSEFAGQTMRINFRGESRQVKLAVNYRFGNNGVKAARVRVTGADEEVKRTQQGAGLMSN